ncbi:MAG: hypothetical protein ACOY4K_01980 [Pseudomonadota bacterium]
MASRLFSGRPEDRRMEGLSDLGAMFGWGCRLAAMPVPPLPAASPEAGRAPAATNGDEALHVR